VHDRMPVILSDQAEEDWLDPATSVEHALSVLSAYPAELMTATLASRAVNSVRNDSPELLVA
jgi:putative SOS response-associated peptidase YedK